LQQLKRYIQEKKKPDYYIFRKNTFLRTWGRNSTVIKKQSKIIKLLKAIVKGKVRDY
jgi:hypothetical protein